MTLFLHCAIIFCTDPLTMLTLHKGYCGVDSFNVSWSSVAYSACGLSSYSYNITLIKLGDDHITISTNITEATTYYHFTGLNSSTVYVAVILPIFNKNLGNATEMKVTTENQTSTFTSTYI